MILKPATVSELRHCLPASGQKVRSVDVSAFNRIVEYHPEDMTVTVEAGVPLAHLQEHLRAHNQWLPVDPPRAMNVGTLISTNASGPRRYGYGTIREYLIGLTVVLADGRLVKSGGKVVKNVAGYDLQKLFVGGFDSLGIIVEATFKILPCPAHERILQTNGAAAIARVLSSPITPTILDMHRDTVVLGLAGTQAEVEWQANEAAKLGFKEEGDLDYEREFWGRTPEPHRKSVLPAKLLDALIGMLDYVARAGNGVIYYRGAEAPETSKLPTALMKRLKDTFDPKGILPEAPW